VDGLEGALTAALLLCLLSGNKVQVCSRQCEELRADKDGIVTSFYRLECNHHCASHVDHRCCQCREKESNR
jgi:hypothetical protein